VVDRTRGRGPMAADFQATMGLTQRASLARLGAATGVYEIPLNSQDGVSRPSGDSATVRALAAQPLSAPGPHRSGSAHLTADPRSSHLVGE